MVTVYDVRAEDLIKKAVEKLKELGEIKPPEYVKYVKTGTDKERAPESKDFWYIRCASLLRKIYLTPTGVSKLRVYYGGRKEHSVGREHHADAGGSIIRKGLQQLEKLGFIAKGKKGRVITSKGRAFLDNIAHEVKKGS
ncbi:30S ribosomal protein S19e [Candidatus Micrarchaeota archaeon]|nr:30S ribosomal protein S19e [Candidatus Micrarchaeota archaeon]